MPIYEYQCNACGHEFEAIQRISDDPLTGCPQCEKPDLKKLISATGFRLKGSGWYETDFKGGGKQRNLAGEKSTSDSSKNKTDSSKSSGEKASSSQSAK